MGSQPSGPCSNSPHFLHRFSRDRERMANVWSLHIASLSTCTGTPFEKPRQAKNAWKMQGIGHLTDGQSRSYWLILRMALLVSRPPHADVRIHVQSLWAWLGSPAAHRRSGAAQAPGRPAGPAARASGEPDAGDVLVVRSGVRHPGELSDPRELGTHGLDSGGGLPDRHPSKRPSIPSAWYRASHAEIFERGAWSTAANSPLVRPSAFRTTARNRLATR